MIKLIFMISMIIFPASAKIKDFENPALSPEIRVADLLSRMSILEKISQLGTSSPALPNLGIKAYEYGNEALHGVVADGATVFPQPIGLSATWDTGLVFKVAGAISDEARALSNQTGKGLTYWAPTANMARDPRWGRTEETFGEDVYLAKKFVINFIKGMQGDDPKYLKTIATVKHFACNNMENNRYAASSSVDERSLREYYLPVFKAAVAEAHSGSVMSAYNALNTVPCSSNPLLLYEILRKEWGFTGYVVSDCDAIAYICKKHHYVSSYPDAAAAAIKAGCDLCCGPTYQQYLPLALADRLWFFNQADIDSALSRILMARTRLGDFDPPAMVPYTSLSSSTITNQDHKDLALQAARESMVLLKNNGILPLDTATFKSIAVIGPNANICRFGEYSGTPVSPISPLQGIQNRLGDSTGKTVTFASGCTIAGTKNEADFEKAVSIARSSTLAVMFMGTDNDYVGENRDLDNLNLPGVQDDLIKAVYQANPQTIVVLINGNPLSINWVQANVPGIIEAWYAGQSQGSAIAEVLLGDYNPGGKLTSTWVKSSADLPDMQDYNIFNNRTYMYFSGTPLYPFGYGLSYTTFSINNLQIAPNSIGPGNTALISVDVKNTGLRSGDDVVQLYIQESVSRAKSGRQLKGFQRVFLEAGETKTVSFNLPYEELSFWDVATHASTVEGGTSNIMVGSSSVDIGVSGQITAVSSPNGLGKKEILSSLTITQSGLNNWRINFIGRGAHRADIIRLDGRTVFSIEHSGYGVFRWRPPSPGVYLLKLTDGNLKQTRVISAFR
jgi:Beta-glucosidase-related glycosidases